MARRNWALQTLGFSPRRGAEPEPDAKPAGFSAPRLMGAAQMGGRELRARIPGSARAEVGGVAGRKQQMY